MLDNNHEKAPVDGRKVKIIKRKLRKMQTYEKSVNDYIYKLIRERQKQEKECKTKSRDLKKSASLFVARRMNAIVMHRNETLSNVVDCVQDMYDQEDKNNFKTKKTILIDAIDNEVRRNSIRTQTLRLRGSPETYKQGNIEEKTVGEQKISEAAKTLKIKDV